jgi:hypothetical protein
MAGSQLESPPAATASSPSTARIERPVSRVPSVPAVTCQSTCVELVGSICSRDHLFVVLGGWHRRWPASEPASHRVDDQMRITGGDQSELHTKLAFPRPAHGRGDSRAMRRTWQPRDDGKRRSGRRWSYRLETGAAKPDVHGDGLEGRPTRKLVLDLDFDRDSEVHSPVLHAATARRRTSVVRAGRARGYVRPRLSVIQITRPLNWRISPGRLMNSQPFTSFGREPVERRRRGRRQRI